jgi:hypothetical protein
MSQMTRRVFHRGAAVELEKLLHREAIGITDRIGFTVSHGEFLS